jgi:hypothetical protein
MSVTTSSVAVNSTARAFRSPTSSSIVIVPCAQQPSVGMALRAFTRPALSSA